MDELSENTASESTVEETPERILFKSLVTSLNNILTGRESARKWFLPKEQQAHNDLIKIRDELNVHLKSNDQILSTVDYKSYQNRMSQVFHTLVYQNSYGRVYPLVELLRKELYPIQRFWWKYCEIYRDRYLRLKRQSELQHIKNGLALEVFDVIISSLERDRINVSEIKLDNLKHLSMLTNIMVMLNKVNPGIASSLYTDAQIYADTTERCSSDLPERKLFASLSDCLLAICSERLGRSIAKDHTLLEPGVSQKYEYQDDVDQRIVKRSLSTDKPPLVPSATVLPPHANEQAVIENLLLIKAELDTLVQATDQVVYSASYKNFQSRIVSLLDRLNSRCYGSVPLPLAAQIKSWIKTIEQYWGEYCEKCSYQYAEDLCQFNAYERQHNLTNQLFDLLHLYQNTLDTFADQTLSQSDKIDEMQFVNVLKLIKEIVVLSTANTASLSSRAANSVPDVAEAAATAALPKALSAPAVLQQEQKNARKLQQENPCEFEKKQLELCISKTRYLIIDRLLDVYNALLPQQPYQTFFQGYSAAVALKSVLHALLTPENLRKSMADCLILLMPVYENGLAVYAECSRIYQDNRDSDHVPSYYPSEKQRLNALSELMISGNFLPENLILANRLKTEAEQAVQLPYLFNKSPIASPSR